MEIGGKEMVKKTINGREYLLREYNVADIDKLAIRMMEENQIAGLLAFRNIQNPEETYFRYDCRMGNTLEEWLLSVRTKNEVLHLLESILAVCDEVEAYLLDKGGLWTTIDGVIVENDTVYMAYLPDISYRSGNVLELIQAILPRVKFARDEKYTYIFDLMNAFSRKEITNVAELKKWLRVFHSNSENIKEDDSYSFDKNVQTETSDRKENVVSLEIEDKPGLFKKTDKANKKIEKINKKEETEKEASRGSDLFESFMSGNTGKTDKTDTVDKSDKKLAAEKKTEKKSSGLFGRKKKEEQDEAIIRIENAAIAPLKAKENVINEIEYTDRTVIMEAEETAYLLRVKTGEEFHLTKQNCEIGRGNAADIMISGNAAIARRQARIYVEDGYYYIIDEGSSNGTCLDGVRLQVGQPYRLGSSSRIQFADENFTFELRS